MIKFLIQSDAERTVTVLLDMLSILWQRARSRRPMELGSTILCGVFGAGWGDPVKLDGARKV